MEVKDSSEVSISKVGTRSRRSSKDLAKNNIEAIEKVSDTLAESSAKDLPNGEEHLDDSKDGKEEESARGSVEPDGADEVSVGDENIDSVIKESSSVEPVKDSSVAEDSVVNQSLFVKEEHCDIDIKEESNFDDPVGESDSSSENWNLNIDTSGSSVPSERAGSEREEVGEETRTNNKETPVREGDVEDYHSDGSESFLGFVEETSDVHSILKRVIENLETNGSVSDDDDFLWNASPKQDEDASSTSQKLTPLTNHDSMKYSASVSRRSRKSTKESVEGAAVNNSPGRLDGGNTTDMVASEDVGVSVASSSPSPSLARGKKSHVDLSNPAFRKPMELGWKRELVYRNTSDNSGLKRNADIYYYTPLGKKVRSNREVVENLVGEDLTVDNFTFFKEPLGLDDPTKEIIRDAKRASTKEPVGAPPKKVAKISKAITPTKESLKPSTEQLASKPVVVLYKDPVISVPKQPLPPPLPPAPPEPAVTVAVTPSPKQKPVPRAFPRVKVTPLRSQRKFQNVTPNSTPNSKPASANRTKKNSNTSGELVMGMLPPMWKDPSAVPANKKVALTSNSTISASPQVAASSPSAPSPSTAPTKNSSSSTPRTSTAKEVLTEEVRVKRIETERHFMQFFMQNLVAGYTALGHVFQYLKVQELLRASRVCRMWKDLASQASLWRTVRMKNSQVVNWKGCAEALQRYGTVELDLRKMLIPGKANVMWDDFLSVVGTIPSLRRLELCKCPADVLDRIAEQCPQLQSITALSIKCSSINLRFVQNFKNLQELRLKSIQGIDLLCSLDVLKSLENLKHLSLTTFKEFGRKDPNVIGSITSLESLELGDFCDFPESFGQSLSNLTNLQRLRLEKGQGKMCPTFKVLAGIRTLPRLTQLELVNFDIKPGFDVALEQCTNIRRLLIIPTYVSQSATTNHMVLGGVTKLGNSLVDFVWGVTHELLRVTELFVDQCEGQKGTRIPPKDNKKNGTSDSIPVLKPVPGLVADALAENGSENKSPDSKQKFAKEEILSEDNKTSAATQQVDILPLSKLQMLLTNALPNTKVKILKIPFHATWRQSIGDHSH